MTVNKLQRIDDNEFPRKNIPLFVKVWEME